MKKLRKVLKQKIIFYSKVVLALSAFSLLYFYIIPVGFRKVLLYYLLLINLYFAFKQPKVSILINAFAFIILFVTFPLHRWGVIIIFTLLLASTIFIPYYFGWFRYWEHKQFQRQRRPKVRQLKELDETLQEYVAVHQDLDKEINRISRLYILGRELVEHMDINEVISNLQRVLLDQPGIKSVSIFEWNMSDWKPLYLSQPQHKVRWMEFIRHHRNLFQRKKFRLLPTPSWLSNQSVIFWPVRLEEDLLACVLLTSEEAYASRYLEEGEIFIPQIALGLRRTRLFAEVQERSRIDGLTGLYLRRYFLERLYVEIQRAKRYSSGFSILMGDIDFFKEVNDTYGHLVGDEVLQGLAKLLVDSTPPGALVGRYGGEEFIILLPLISPKEALKTANNINKTVAQREFMTNGSTFHVTISIGLSHYSIDGTNVKDLLSASDQALYWVKTNGRDNIKEYQQFRKVSASGDETGQKKKQEQIRIR